MKLYSCGPIGEVDSLLLFLSCGRGSTFFQGVLFFGFKKTWSTSTQLMLLTGKEKPLNFYNGRYLFFNPCICRLHGSC